MKCACKGDCGCKNCSCGAQATLFATLASPTRLQVLEALMRGPKDVSSLQKITAEEQSAVSHALAHLSRAGLVAVERDGKRRIYSLKKDVYAPLMELATAHARENTALERPCICGGN